MNESETLTIGWHQVIHWHNGVDVHTFRLGAMSTTATTTMQCALVSWTRWSPS